MQGTWFKSNICERVWLRLIGYSKGQFRRGHFILPVVFLLFFLLSCKKEKPLVYNFPVNSLARTIAKFNIKLDNKVSYDGLGSIRIDCEDTTTAYLFVLRDIPVERPKLVWEVYCKSKDLKGKAFLEIGVQIPGKYGKGVETFLHCSRDSLCGTTDWEKMEVEFLVMEKRKVDIAQLNMIVEGSGTVWIDQVRLTVLPIR